MVRVRLFLCPLFCTEVDWKLLLFFLHAARVFAFPLLLMDSYNKLLMFLDSLRCLAMQYLCPSIVINILSTSLFQSQTIIQQYRIG
uniref:Uncharacterized protein n=1 Tax=Arundo donax TaxID=35708 RepID=A0A0A9CV16_ARUDO